MTVEVDQLAPRRSRYGYPALVASLALNLLFVGGIAAAAWHHNHEAPSVVEPGLLGFVKELPSDRQDAVRNEISSARASMKDLRAGVRTAWIDANGLLTAEPFDKEKFKTALARLREIEDQYKTALNNALADTAGTFTPEERKLLQSWREKRRPRLLMRTGDKPNDDDGKSD